MAAPRRVLDPDYLFNIFRLNKWFAISSVLLLVGMLAMVQKDYDREWKGWQRKFRTLEIQKTEEAIAKTNEELKANPEYQKALEAVHAADADFRKKETDLFARKKALEELDRKKFVANTLFLNEKSTFSALRYEVEEARHHLPENVDEITKTYNQLSGELKAHENRLKNLKKKPAAKQGDDDENLKARRAETLASIEKAGQSVKAFLNRHAPILDQEKKAEKIEKRYKKIEAAVAAAQRNLEEIDKEYSEARKRVDAFSEEKKKAEAELTKLQSGLERLKRKAKGIERSFVNDVLRDLPMLDFIDPSLRVKEIVVSDLYDDYTFTKVPRADTCATCHIAIDKVGYEDQPNPLKTHPNLPLFLSAKSSHPLAGYGCTVCHGGLGSGLTFTNAVHTPQNPEQGEQWRKKYHWHPVEAKHWSDPMLPLPQTEATCYGCHREDVDIPQGDEIQQGILLVERSGCFGCHKIEGWESVRKTGPTLRRITSKVGEEWMTKWIRNPKLFRPTTNMPQIFDQSNASDTASKRRSSVEIAGIVTYLRSKAEPAQLSTVPGSSGGNAPGNAEEGKKLFGSVGCLGCHTMDDFPDKRPHGLGPELSQVGSKLSAPWLAAWLRNPKEYWPDTRMPSLRLTEGEIANLTAYLLSKKNEAFDSSSVPRWDARMLDDVTVDFLSMRMTKPEAEAKLKSMSQDEKLLFVGERAISHHGCFGCHDIPGFENAKPIGTELTYEASKPLSQFDFGLVDIEPTVADWIYQKMMEPRIFDRDKEKEPLEKLRMPNFHFSPEEGKTVLTFVLALRKYDVPLHRKPALTAEREAIRAGRRHIRNFNCRGCHTIEAQGGEILGQYEDPSLGPPNLVGEGQKVQQAWLYGFLAKPTTIRPWLKVRMPSFGFKSDQLNTTIRYFRALDHLPVQIEEPPAIALSPRQAKSGQEIFTQLKCAQCHVLGAIPADQETSNLAPDFKLTKTRLRYDWIADWLRDPQKLLPGTRMPNFFYYEGQPMYPDADPKMTAVRDYIYTLK
ncbi:MAG TPA: c-type cytochrome [Bdellovibrionota bacterium]|nr:c-type cytochrome [Bdellovibrionota bacterium]